VALFLFIGKLNVVFVIQSCLSDLGAVSNHFKDVLDFGFSQLNGTAVKPRVKPLVDAFLNVNHNITEVSLLSLASLFFN
jgi:hypothetical protein